MCQGNQPKRRMLWAQHNEWQPFLLVSGPVPAGLLLLLLIRTEIAEEHISGLDSLTRETLPVRSVKNTSEWEVALHKEPEAVQAP